MATRIGYDPVAAYTARLALRAYFFQDRKLTTQVLSEIANEARIGLGLEPRQIDSSREFIQRKLVSGYKISEQDKNLITLLVRSSERGVIIPSTEEWPRLWRFLFTPAHIEVRTAASQGSIKSMTSDGLNFHRFTCSIPAYPAVDFKEFLVTEGETINPQEFKNFLDYYFAYSRPGGKEQLIDQENQSKGDDALIYFKTLARKPMLYIMYCGKEIYLGQTGEPNIRFIGHNRDKKPNKVIIIFPAPHESELSDSDLNAAESLWISYYDEICETMNKNLGSDSLPVTMTDVRKSTCFVTSACAAILLLSKEHAEFKLPLFKIIDKSY